MVQDVNLESINYVIVMENCKRFGDINYQYDCCTYFQSITKIGQYHLAVTSETF